MELKINYVDSCLTSGSVQIQPMTIAPKIVDLNTAADVAQIPWPTGVYDFSSESSSSKCGPMTVTLVNPPSYLTQDGPTAMVVSTSQVTLADIGTNAINFEQSLQYYTDYKLSGQFDIKF